MEIKFEKDDLEQFYQDGKVRNKKYRYKFSIQQNIWGQDSFDTFKTKLFN